MYHKIPLRHKYNPMIPNRISPTEREMLLHEIEKLLKPIIRKSKYVEYSTGSKSIKEPSTQLTMNYKNYQIKVIVK